VDWIGITGGAFIIWSGSVVVYVSFRARSSRWKAYLTILGGSKVLLGADILVFSLWSEPRPEAVESLFLPILLVALAAIVISSVAMVVIRLFSYSRLGDACASNKPIQD
jgi:hypothetical protein